MELLKSNLGLANSKSCHAKLCSIGLKKRRNSLSSLIHTRDQEPRRQSLVGGDVLILQGRLQTTEPGQSPRRELPSTSLESANLLLEIVDMGHATGALRPQR